MQKIKNWLIRVIIAGSIIMLGYHLGTDFKLLPLRMYHITNIPCVLAYVFWIALGFIAVVKALKWMRSKFEEKGLDDCDSKKARGIFILILLLDAGYVLSFLGSNIFTGLAYDEFGAIVIGIFLIAILYALKPDKKSKNTGWIGEIDGATPGKEVKKGDLTKPTMVTEVKKETTKGGDIDN